MRLLNLGYANLTSLLAEAKPDAIDICLPHHLHEPAVVEAAAAGVHILCEKPLATTADELQRMQGAVEASGKVFVVGHNQAFRPAVEAIAALIADGALGTLQRVRIEGNYDLASLVTRETFGWRAHKDTSGGGELLDSGLHALYLVCLLAGQRPTAVTAMLANHKMSFLDGEDSAEVLIRFDGGAIGHVSTTWAGLGVGMSETIDVIGSLGAAHADDRELRIRIGDETTVRPLETAEPHARLMQHFVDCCRGLTTPRQGFADGALAVGLALAAAEADTTGRVVEVSP